LRQKKERKRTVFLLDEKGGGRYLPFFFYTKGEGKKGNPLLNKEGRKGPSLNWPRGKKKKKERERCRKMGKENELRT